MNCEVFYVFTLKNGKQARVGGLSSADSRGNSHMQYFLQDIFAMTRSHWSNYINKLDVAMTLAKSSFGIKDYILEESNVYSALMFCDATLHEQLQLTPFYKGDAVCASVDVIHHITTLSKHTKLLIRDGWDEWSRYENINNDLRNHRACIGLTVTYVFIAKNTKCNSLTVQYFLNKTIANAEETKKMVRNEEAAAINALASYHSCMIKIIEDIEEAKSAMLVDHVRFCTMKSNEHLWTCNALVTACNTIARIINQS